MEATMATSLNCIEYSRIVHSHTKIETDSCIATRVFSKQKAENHMASERMWDNWIQTTTSVLFSQWSFHVFRSRSILKQMLK